MAVRFDPARTERMYATPTIATQRARTRAALGPRPGERGLDIGCGPGFLTCELAGDVGPTGRIVGIDSSPEMRGAAAARVAREGLGDRVELVAGDAARLEFPAGAFDFVAAVQVYLYVPEISRALAEVVRILRPGGRLAVVDTDWDSCVWLTDDRERHRRVMEARLAQFVNPHLPPRLPGLLHGAGLRLTHAEAIPLLELHHGTGTFNGDLIAVTTAVAIEHGLPRGDADAWAADLRRRTAEGEYFFSVNRFLFLAEKPTA